MNNDDRIPAYQRSTAASRRRMAIGPALSRPPRRPATAAVSSRSAPPQDSSHAPPPTGHRTVSTEAAGRVAPAADSALSYHRARRPAAFIAPFSRPTLRPAIQQSRPSALPPNNRTVSTEAAGRVASAADGALSYHRAQRTAAFIPPFSRPTRRPAIHQSTPSAPPPNNRFAGEGNYAARRVLAGSNSALAPHRAQRPRKADFAADRDTNRQLLTPLTVAPVAAPIAAVPQPVAQISQRSSRPAPAYVCSDPFAPPFTRPNTPYRLQHGIVRARDLPADWPFVVPVPVSREGRPSRERVKDRL
ncbi:hypothetical protein FN846DRAFT_892855 [Sphaerosporella brunnea]|uniref:Uncharacterized protein n=1 Tax=Sphaerosporella brunnea TaxID=1250544 RepID=A0A5J5EN56_9PEZI|nr:hypothetical protein FN846DRAFT_892855 [Sphaerosporella brunnea]